MGSMIVCLLFFPLLTDDGRVEFWLETLIFSPFQESWFINRNFPEKKKKVKYEPFDLMFVWLLVNHDMSGSHVDCLVFSIDPCVNNIKLKMCLNYFLMFMFFKPFYD